MRYLPDHDLYEIAESEAGAVLAKLREQGYQWLQEGRGHHNLYDRSGNVCVGEVFNHKLYLDGRVREDLVVIMSGYAGASP